MDVAPCGKPRDHTTPMLVYQVIKGVARIDQNQNPSQSSCMKRWGRYICMDQAVCVRPLVLQIHGSSRVCWATHATDPWINQCVSGHSCYISMDQAVCVGLLTLQIHGSSSVCWATHATYAPSQQCANKMQYTLVKLLWIVQFLLSIISKFHHFKLITSCRTIAHRLCLRTKFSLT